MAQYSIDVKKDQESLHYVELATAKFGITNQLIISNQKRLDPPPALISYAEYGRKGRIFYKNQWLESCTPIRSSYDWIWRKYDQSYRETIDQDAYLEKYGKLFAYSDLFFYFHHQGHRYHGSFSYINEVSRNKVAFKDGSVINGEVALKIFYEYEKLRENRIHYVVTGDEDYFTEPDKPGNLQIHFIKNKEVKEERYDGTSSLYLKDYKKPIINKTPLALKLAQGYSTVACGWANDIWVHPGNTLRMTYAGDQYSFTIWREKPTQESDTGTVLEYDQKHMELIQWRKK